MLWDTCEDACCSNCCKNLSRFIVSVEFYDFRLVHRHRIGAVFAEGKTPFDHNFTGQSDDVFFSLLCVCTKQSIINIHIICEFPNYCRILKLIQMILNSSIEKKWTSNIAENGAVKLHYSSMSPYIPK